MILSCTDPGRLANGRPQMIARTGPRARVADQAVGVLGRAVGDGHVGVLLVEQIDKGAFAFDAQVAGLAAGDGAGPR